MSEHDNQPPSEVREERAYKPILMIFPRDFTPDAIAEAIQDLRRAHGHSAGRLVQPRNITSSLLGKGLVITGQGNAPPESPGDAPSTPAKKWSGPIDITGTPEAVDLQIIGARKPKT